MINPPKNIAPEKLFRILLQKIPIMPLDYRIKGAEHIALKVRAISSYDLDQIIIKALIPSLSQEELNLLSVREISTLENKIRETLNTFSPCMGYADWDQWQEVLLQGARHYSNQRQAYALGSCFQVINDIVIECPERFFGIPIIDLIDAHYFIYRACKTFYFEHLSKRKS